MEKFLLKQRVKNFQFETIPEPFSVNFILPSIGQLALFFYEVLLMAQKKVFLEDGALDLLAVVANTHLKMGKYTAKRRGWKKSLKTKGVKRESVKRRASVGVSSGIQ